MNVLLVGTVRFSLEVFRTLLDMPVTICGVVTKGQSRFNADHVDLAPYCVEHDIPVKYVRDINAPHIHAWMRELQPDCLLIAGWSQLIDRATIELAPKKAIGFHPAALPANRGRHPLIWALALGLEQTATTYLLLDEGADSGPIVSQRVLPILPDDDAAVLYARMMQQATEQLREFLPRYLHGQLAPRPQDDNQANYWRKRGRADGRIDFRMSATTIYNLVRALTRPYVGAHLDWQGEEVKVWRVAIGPPHAKNMEPGKVLRVVDDQLHVATAEGSIILQEHEFTTLPTENEYL